MKSYRMTIQMKPLQKFFHILLCIVLTFESVDAILWCYHSNETSSEILSHGTIYLVCSSKEIESVDAILWCYHSNETSSEILSHGTIYSVCSSKEIESVDAILWCYLSNETSLAVLSHGTICLVCSSNFRDCGWNPMELPFKRILFSSTSTRYFLFF